MIVTASKLQRKISYIGLDDVLKLSVDTAGALKRLERSPREAESVTNLVTNLKAALDQCPSSEQGNHAYLVEPEIARVWLTVLTAFVRRATRVEKQATQIQFTTNANSVEDAAEKLAAQLQEQLQLPIQSLDSIVDEQTKREAADRDYDRQMATETSPAPHRGTHTPQPAAPTEKRKWDGKHHPKKRPPQLPMAD